MNFFLPFAQKSIDLFFKYNEINYFSNSIYINSFLNAIKEIKQNDIKNEREVNGNILLETWFENMNREFEEKLRSDTFINLLDKYVKSSLDFYNEMYPEVQRFSNKLS